MSYPDTQLLIDGQWQDAADGRTLPVFNPATGAEIGRVAHAGIADLDRALAAAQKGFEAWRDVPAIERGRIMRRAAGLMRERDGFPGSLRSRACDRGFRTLPAAARPARRQHLDPLVHPGW